MNQRGRRWGNDSKIVDMDVDLAQPEFDGLWDKQAVKQEIDPLFNRSKHWKTKMDKVIVN